MRESIPAGTCFVALPEEFKMKRGGELRCARVAYEALGRLNAARDNVVLVLPGLSPDAHVASHDGDPAPGWWEEMVGPGKPVDTDRWCVICVNSLGSCKGSTGPASAPAGVAGPYALDFPDLSIEDIADAAAFAVRSLGVERVACVIGASMGGMSALALLARHPGLARNHVNISGATHSLPFATAVRSLQREAIRSDPLWNGGRYDAGSYPQRGMVLARKLGMTTYRSPAEWNERFTRRRPDAGTKRDTFEPEFEVELYLEHCARRFVRSFDPNCYLYLSRCIDWFDLTESGGGTAAEALSRLDVEQALVLGVRSDLLFPVDQQREIADGLTAGGTEVDFVELDSKEGHDAFLVDILGFGPPVAKFLRNL